MVGVKGDSYSRVWSRRILDAIRNMAGDANSEEEPRLRVVPGSAKRVHGYAGVPALAPECIFSTTEIHQSSLRQTLEWYAFVLGSNKHEITGGQS